LAFFTEAQMISRPAMKWLIGGGVLAVLAAFSWIGFRREYVVPASGLLDITAVAGSRHIVVSGVLLSSMSYVRKTTTEPYRDGVIVRVYVGLIPTTGNLDKLTRTFATSVPRSRDTRVIYVGDGQQWETVGRLYGAAVRMPRDENAAAKIVWRENER
jgi:hypothetical protein